MKSLRHWKIILSLCAIFIAGGVVGSVATLRAVKRAVAIKPTPKDWAQMTLQRLENRLKLTPEQLEKVRPIIEETSLELRRIRQSTVEETGQAVRRAHDRISELLTPEQQKRMERLKRDRREALRQRLDDSGSSTNQFTR